MTSSSIIHSLRDTLEKSESLARAVNQKLSTALEQTHPSREVGAGEEVYLLAELAELMESLYENLNKAEEAMRGAKGLVPQEVEVEEVREGAEGSMG